MKPTNFENEGKIIWHANGLTALAFFLILAILSIVGMFFTINMLATRQWSTVLATTCLVVNSFLFTALMASVAGFKILKPNEAMVFTLFGAYAGCLSKAGFYYINPFAVAIAPLPENATSGKFNITSSTIQGTINKVKKTISLKVSTLNNDEQKINDSLGNPIIIGIVVIWKVVNPTKAVLNVDSYTEYLSIQCDSALRNIVRLYPYDSTDDTAEKSLRGSSQEIATKLKEEIQSKMLLAGIEIIEARITKLSYAPEIAAVMLQRQQASAIIAARQMIVEGAVGMVEMALEKLSANDIVNLDEERKAAMISNLLVVLCSNKETQPVVNSGSIY